MNVVLPFTLISAFIFEKFLFRFFLLYKLVFEKSDDGMSVVTVSPHFFQKRPVFKKKNKNILVFSFKIM